LPMWSKAKFAAWVWTAICWACAPLCLRRSEFRARTITAAQSKKAQSVDRAFLCD
jgi:hypothetical protein